LSTQPIQQPAPQILERQVGPFTVRIDRLLCVGFGDCIEAAPDFFELDGDGIARFKDLYECAEEMLMQACRICPVDALTVLDANGVQLVP
jgi:ferredoxin